MCHLLTFMGCPSMSLALMRKMLEGLKVMPASNRSDYQESLKYIENFYNKFATQ